MAPTAGMIRYNTDNKYWERSVNEGSSWVQLDLSGTTTVVPVPAGSNKQVQFNDSSALGGDAGLTFDKATDILTLLGLFDISGAAAGQIKFPATQNASADANVLDDYEENTWTPVIGGGGGTSGQSYGTQYGTFFKIGKFVVAIFYTVFSNKGTITGNLQLQGLPFTSGSGGDIQGAGMTYATGLALNLVSIKLLIGAGVTAATFYKRSAASADEITMDTNDVDNDSSFAGFIIYRADN